jgi:hypothetical protein
MTEDAEQHDEADGQDVEADPPDGEQLAHVWTLPNVPVRAAGQPSERRRYPRRPVHSREEPVGAYQRHPRPVAAEDHPECPVEILDRVTAGWVSETPLAWFVHGHGGAAALTQCRRQVGFDQRPGIGAVAEQRPAGGEHVVEPLDATVAGAYTRVGKRPPSEAGIRQPAQAGTAAKPTLAKPATGDGGAIERAQAHTGSGGARP